jgi:hypothetical protein
MQRSVSAERPKGASQLIPITKIVKHWGKDEESRNRFAMCLSGYYAKKGIPQKDCEAQIKEICRRCEDEEEGNRISAMKCTYQKVAAGKISEVQGYSGLRKLMGKDLSEDRLSDVEIVELLKETHGDEFTYVYGLGWYRKQGHVYVEDKDGAGLYKALVQLAPEQLDMHGRIQGVLQCAYSGRGHLLIPAQIGHLLRAKSAGRYDANRPPLSA